MAYWQTSQSSWSMLVQLVSGSISSRLVSSHFGALSALNCAPLNQLRGEQHRLLVRLISEIGKFFKLSKSERRWDKNKQLVIWIALDLEVFGIVIGFFLLLRNRNCSHFSLNPSFSCCCRRRRRRHSNWTHWNDIKWEAAHSLVRLICLNKQSRFVIS